MARPSPSRSCARLDIRLTRRADGAIVFEARRPDGTTTWQRRTGPTAEFFAVHDLTHYAVESALGARAGFYGLLADGWSLDDFGHPWPRGPLPVESGAIEMIVGAFDQARAAHAPLTADVCNETLDQYYATRGLSPPRYVSEAELDAARRILSDVVWRWQALGNGGTLTVGFPGDATPAG